jgi:Zn-dependent M28 family amino/carboxypeptidase
MLATETPLPTLAPSSAPSYVPFATDDPGEPFQGERAYQDVENQVAFGPRLPGSQAHSQTIDYIQAELEEAGWESWLQETRFGGQQIRNIIATREDLEEFEAPWIILGAHYDSRLIADQDPDRSRQSQPVPGANDGASGVAVLLELARTLPDELDKRVWLVFFDAEDNGRIPGWDWILGSRAFVESLEGGLHTALPQTALPEAVVIVDMVGDANLNVRLEQNSDPGLAAEIWQAAEDLGYGNQMINEPGPRILDDHVPFLEAGIPAVDIIDFDYPYWHTTEDTVDKVSPQSLKVVGETLLSWLNRPRSP